MSNTYPIRQRFFDQLVKPEANVNVPTYNKGMRLTGSFAGQLAKLKVGEIASRVEVANHVLMLDSNGIQEAKQKFRDRWRTSVVRVQGELDIKFDTECFLVMSPSNVALMVYTVERVE